MRWLRLWRRGARRNIRLHGSPTVKYTPSQIRQMIEELPPEFRQPIRYLSVDGAPPLIAETDVAVPASDGGPPPPLGRTELRSWIIEDIPMGFSLANPALLDSTDRKLRLIESLKRTQRNRLAALDDEVASDLAAIQRIVHAFPDKTYLQLLRRERDSKAHDTPGAAAAAGMSVDHALAMLFLRLGPPPDPTETEFTPASSGGGGASR